jgi:hypothetical protein
MSDDQERFELGPCCMCDGDQVTTIVMLNRRCAVAGHGWGCVVCELPMDGASAVLCEPCFERYSADNALLTTACRGYPTTDGRIPIAELPPGEFKHRDVDHG